jgi:hypothetical protein
MEVYHPNDTFQFNHLHLSPPNSITGGSYLTKYAYYESKKPLYIQTPKTQSKQGIVVSGKKAHIDLLLTGANEHDAAFIEWITELEKHSVELLYEKRHLWFTQELDKVDIENSFTSPIRAFKTGNYLVRVNLELNRIQTHIQPFLCKVFDENRTIVPVDYVKAEHNIISIIEFQGIKFTARSFQMELILRQVLVIPELPLFETCIITTNTNTPPRMEEHLGKEADETEPLTNNVVGNDINETREMIEKLDESLGHPIRNTASTSDFDQVNRVSNVPPLESATAATASSCGLKHFECKEIDIDFKDISDVIDTKEPTFDISSSAESANSSDPHHRPQCGSLTATISTNKSKLTNNGVNNGGLLTLKKHKEVIYEMYKVAKRKAQEAKKAAIRAYLEAKEIKASYMLDDLDDFDSETSGSGSGSDED